MHNMGIALNIHKFFNLNRTGFGDLHKKKWIKQHTQFAKSAKQLGSYKTKHWRNNMTVAVYEMLKSFELHQTSD